MKGGWLVCVEGSYGEGVWGGRLVWEVGRCVCEGRLVSVCRGLIWGGCVGGGEVGVGGREVCVRREVG